MLAFVVHGVARVSTESIIMAGEGLGIEARDLLGDELAVGVVSEGGGADGIGGGGLAAHCVVGVGDVGGGVGIVHGKELPPGVVGVGGDDAASVGAGGEFAVVGVGVGQPLAVGVGLGKEDARGFGPHRRPRCDR